MSDSNDKKESAKEGIAALLNPAEMFKLGRLTLFSRYTVEGNLAGAHKSPLQGPSSEFATHKQYGLGDDPKHIDWRVFARTDKHYVKQFDDETNLRVYLAFDRSASMDFSSSPDGPTKFHHASRLAAAGLTTSEVDAFLRAWAEPLFGTSWPLDEDQAARRDLSVRSRRPIAGPPPTLIYVMPEATVSQLAELTITPTPRSVRRVMVVRVDLPR